LDGTRRGAEIADVLIDLRKRRGCHPQDLGFVREQRQGLCHLVAGRRADLTQVLRKNQVGPELLQKLFIDLIKALTGSQPRRDGHVDFPLAHALERKHIANDDRSPPDFGRIVAFVGDADQEIDQSQRAHHLRSGR
jgi:hypothetical protein